MKHSILGLAALLCLAAPAAAQTSYSGSAIGGMYSADFRLMTVNTITASQVITAADVASWSVTVRGNGTTTFTDASPNTALNIPGTALTADSAGLYFNYSGLGYLQFVSRDGRQNELLFCTAVCNGSTPQSYIVSADSSDSTPVSGGVVQIAAAATPEPGAWALMIGGFAAIGAALRRRRRQRGSLAPTA